MVWGVWPLLIIHGCVICRALVRRVNRKIVRKKPCSRSRNSFQHADAAFHPHLSVAQGEYA